MKLNALTTGLMLAGLMASQTVLATQTGDILARVRLINISPNVDSGVITAIGGGAPLGANATIDVDAKATLDVDFTWFVNDHFGLELLLDLSSVHEVNGAGDLATAGKLGEVRVLPPALVAQYHFSPGSNIRPYAGAGVNYTFFLSEKTTATTTGALGATSSGLEVDDTFAFVFQAGVDIDIDKDWYFNLDAKYMLMNTTATISANGAPAATVEFDLDPLVIGAGIGMRF